MSRHGLAWWQDIQDVIDEGAAMDAEDKRLRFEREQPRCGGCGLPIEDAEDGWRDIDGSYDCRDGQPHGLYVSRCPSCGGLNGAHGLVHVRHGNGGGHNEPCPTTERGRP